MIDTREFILSFDVNDPLSACKNKENFIINEFNKLYKNKCYQEVFIKDIIEILYISECKILLNNFDLTKGQINAKINCEIIILNTGLEFLSNVRITKTEPLIEGSHDYAKISISGMPPVRKGDIVTILIHRVVYPPENVMIIIGKLITCVMPPELPKFKLQDSLTDDNIIHLKQLANQLDYKMSEMVKTNHANKYTELLYPFTKYKDTSKLKAKSITNIVNDVHKYDLENNVWTSDLTIGKELGLINQEKDGINVKPITTYVFLHMMLLRSLFFCEAIIDLAKMYGGSPPKHIEAYMKKFQKN
jgi:hypothetical protein